ncbi:hypothetical protein B9Z19DRAFT_1122557 [Tuber borchii]|uniref:Uncharacterized protein n=1 Tax=Tuber borchii TaxID=42251 RepID=A0A2T7A082_TUBBO|nr:hypothetical protein B9Z19DRAFT_1122557 [Tuber borchii]
MSGSGTRWLAPELAGWLTFPPADAPDGNEIIWIAYRLLGLPGVWACPQTPPPLLSHAEPRWATLSHDVGAFSERLGRE